MQPVLPCPPCLSTCRPSQERAQQLASPNCSKRLPASRLPFLTLTVRHRHGSAVDSRSKRVAEGPRRRQAKGMSSAARKAVGERMKAYWQKREGAAEAPGTETAAEATAEKPSTKPTTKKRTMSAEARARISAAQRSDGRRTERPQRPPKVPVASVVAHPREHRLWDSAPAAPLYCSDSQGHDSHGSGSGKCP